MILVNQHLKEDKIYETHREMFPRLYYQDFSGKLEQISHISVKIIDKNIDVQTDLMDEKMIQKYVTEWLEKERGIAEQKLQEAQNTLEIINEVLKF